MRISEKFTRKQLNSPKCILFSATPLRTLSYFGLISNHFFRNVYVYMRVTTCSCMRLWQILRVTMLRISIANDVLEIHRTKVTIMMTKTTRRAITKKKWEQTNKHLIFANSKSKNSTSKELVQQHISNVYAKHDSINLSHHPICCPFFPFHVFPWFHLRSSVNVMKLVQL